MSLEAFAYATKGIAHELSTSHAKVVEMLEGVEPLLKSMAGNVNSFKMDESDIDLD